jgi:hypothetical protein
MFDSNSTRIDEAFSPKAIRAQLPDDAHEVFFSSRKNRPTSAKSNELVSRNGQLTASANNPRIAFQARISASGL